MLLIRVLGVLSLFYLSVAVNSQGLDEDVLRAYHDSLQSSFYRRHPFFPIQDIHLNNKVGEVHGNPEVQFTEEVKITGQTNDYAHSFYGIPFAKEPDRFEDPVAASYEGDIDASVESNVICYQPSMGEEYEMTEDCLVLNIHVPASVDSESLTTQQFDQLLPVMVWIHGGGFYMGSGTDSMYDGRYLSSSTDTVVVSINYRLGPLGFLSFSKEHGKVINGNQGLKDQQLALEWVQDNIQLFGGDPDQTTIFGESAGAQSVMFHLALESSKGYFKRAIMESNPAAYHFPDLDKAYKLTDELAGKLNCESKYDSTIDCLRMEDASTITATIAEFSIEALASTDSLSIIEPFRPVVDLDLVPEQPLVMFQQGNWNNDVDVILGTNREELGYFSAAFHKNNITILNETVFTILNYYLVGYKHPRIALKASDKYMKWADDHASNGNYTYSDIFAQEVSDLYFVCPTRALARFISSTSKSENTYLYSWDHTLTNQPSMFTSYSCHGFELPYVFDTLGFTGLRVEERTMVEMFSDFWGSFAHTGIPISEHAPNSWPAHKEMTPGTTWNDQNIFMQYPSAIVEEQYNDELCDFWDDLNFYVDMDTSKKSK